MKRFTRAMAFFAIAVSIAGVSFAEDKEIDKADKIKQAQEGLAALGLYKGQTDGNMSMDTREAVKEFKKKEMDMKMPTGMLDEKTCDMISSKAEEKKNKDKEMEKSPMDKPKEMLDEGKSKMMPDAVMPK